MKDNALVRFGSDGQFLVLDDHLAELVGGGVFFSVTKGGDTHVNDQCIADNKNQQCIMLNNICATDVACPEIDVPH